MVPAAELFGKFAEFDVLPTILGPRGFIERVSRSVSDTLLVGCSDELDLSLFKGAHLFLQSRGLVCQTKKSRREVAAKVVHLGI